MSANLAYYSANSQPVVTQLSALGFLDVVETPAGDIFAIEGAGHTLQVSTDDGVSFHAVPGSTGFLVRAGALAVNALGEVLAGTIAASPTVYYCTPTGVTQATGIVGAQTAMTRFSADSGGSVYAINIDSTVLFHSTDHGHTWTPVNCTLTASMGQAYAVEVNAYGLAYAGEIGVYSISNDGGVTFSDFGLERHSVAQPTDYHGNIFGIATDPVTGNLLVGVGNPTALGIPGAIQIHTPLDAPAVWQTTTGTTYEIISGFVFQANGAILAGMINSTLPTTGAIAKSVNGGAAWSIITAQFPSMTGLVRLSIGPSGRMYISANNGLWRSVGQF